MATDRPRPGLGESSLSPDLIAQRGFLTVRRGFDPDEVKAFLAVVADELRAVRQREAALDRARREAEERAAHPSIDENTLMAAVGEQTASILRSAHAAASDIKAKAEDNAARILKEAHDRTASLLDEAETVLAKRTSEADALATRITDAATAEAERIREIARQEGEVTRTQAEAERKLTIEAAHGARERILADLTRRRNVAVVQIEQLRAGRERLLEAYKVVRGTLDEVTSELQRADAEARAAADAAGRRPPPQLDDVEGADSVGGPPAGTAQAAEAVQAVQQTAVKTLRRPRSVKPEVEAPDAPPPTSESTNGEGGSLQVEDLFARIRADNEQSVADEVPADKVPDDKFPEDRVSDDDENILQRRDQAVDQIEASLARKLKRVLQDEQNDLLDRLRGLRTQPTAAQVLPAADAHAVRFSKAGRPLLDQAAQAGAAFATSLTGQTPPERAEIAGLDELAAELAEAVVDPLRRRLEQVFVDSHDDDPAVLVESLGAAYREWKTQRIEQTAADHVANAFGRGAFAAMPEGTTLRWLVQDIDGPCPDCDDNALASGLVKGELFPTGQPFPPAHAGCRCLLIPMAATA